MGFGISPVNTHGNKWILRFGDLRCNLGRAEYAIRFDGKGQALLSYNFQKLAKMRVQERFATRQFDPA